MSHHTLLHRSLRPVVHVLAAAHVTPDQVTLLRLLTGLGGAFALAQGHTGLAIGAGLLMLSAVLDRLDGALARATRHFSAAGWRLDLIADCLSTMGFFVGLGFGERATLMPDLLPATAMWLISPMLGIVAACSIAILFWQLGQARRDADPDEIRPFDPDDVMVVLPGLLWCGLDGTILMAAGLISPIVALSLWLIKRIRHVSALDVPREITS